MIYKKATAEVVLFDNSDVITKSSDVCPGQSPNKAHHECWGSANQTIEGWEPGGGSNTRANVQRYNYR